ncbi:anaphase promoting complex subunit CDC16 NDAI_0C00160 [Naumovozyma dairenensis CBS 421]|uniref:Uncharacterized protein n=1 Tax=Naumovozyma dairenensis (strain ATCC 10597 / BCRC 20456 / CBS 421 / NBRC 0211 / NRRL Y-12639) TaxID=1071378 RepID=G0W7B6_NAUDC|nr:hypothetical protein NDAI_0C00160 [Naumovozyma dairenensis CBS 421]CCD23677.1 hypothetical protein NDAI_0C00160 [Naumovozyma dairenensis CBS 421]
MKNQMSPSQSAQQLHPSQTPSQHNSTLAISPFVVTKSSSRLPTQRPSQGQHAQSVQEGSHHQSPYRALATSPLFQRTNQRATIDDALTTPHQKSTTSQNNNSSLLASMSKIGTFGTTIPSTLRKVSVQREYRDDDINSQPQGDNTGEKGNNANGNNLLSVDASSYNAGHTTTTTTLTTTTRTTATSAEIDYTDLTSIEKLRLWRHDALMQHMYRTAEYIGNKIYTITADPNDAFWLAQVFYNNGSYLRAIELLSKDSYATSNVICRYLMGLCLFKLERFDDALDIVGETNPFATSKEKIDVENPEIPIQADGGIKIESSLCFLRGKIFLSQNNFTKAKQSLKDAILIDVKNFEAYEELICKNLLSPEEQWNLYQSLDFSGLDDNEEMIRNLYKISLSQYLNNAEIESSETLLTQEYGLGNSVDVMRSKLEKLFIQWKFNECLELCERALEDDEFNPTVLPIYLSCLFELGGDNKLFLISHNLAENFPKWAITWFSVATYYMSLNNIPMARKYFSKASILDPTFSSAWLGFAHTFALEGEHDQAISAYSTASRFFPGIHLPNMFLGMEYMASSTLSLAEEYFTLAYDTCRFDPLLLNEMGVLYFKKNELSKSKKYLKKALESLRASNMTSKMAFSIQMNLAHTYRKLGENERAIKCFKAVLEESGHDADIYCSLGFLYLKTNQLEKAVDYLHNSLSLKPTNNSAQELLLHALELNVSMTIDDLHPLMVNAKLQDDTSLQRKRSTGSSFDPINITKKLKITGKSRKPTVDGDGDETMELE